MHFLNGKNPLNKFKVEQLNIGCRFCFVWFDNVCLTLHLFVLHERYTISFYVPILGLGFYLGQFVSSAILRSINDKKLIQ